jgi:hypothetical protein
MRGMTIDSTSVGAPSRFHTLDHLQQALATRTAAPADAGTLSLIVRRVEGGVRERLERTRLTRDAGVPGDAWQRASDRADVAQITVMETEIAQLVANGQSEDLFGDQLFVTLDLSVDNLPVGSQVRIGSALLEVTPQPHNGCRKFRERFGDAALRFVSMKELRHRNLRGIYMRVIEDGEAAVGDPVSVVTRPPAA